MSFWFTHTQLGRVPAYSILQVDKHLVHADRLSAPPTSKHVMKLVWL